MLLQARLNLFVVSWILLSTDDENISWQIWEKYIRYTSNIKKIIIYLKMFIISGNFFSLFLLYLFLSFSTLWSGKDVRNNKSVVSGLIRHDRCYPRNMIPYTWIYKVLFIHMLNSNCLPVDQTHLITCLSTQ